MIQRVDMQHVALVLFFAFCRVIGTMCALPDLSVAKNTAILAEEGVTCPMDGTIMCPPSVTSSPERQVKPNIVMDVDHVAPLFCPMAVLAIASVPMPCSWSSVSSIVPISIASSSVLRI